MRRNFAATGWRSDHAEHLLVVSGNDIPSSRLLSTRCDLLNGSYRSNAPFVNFNWATHILRVGCHHQTAHISVVSQVLAAQRCIVHCPSCDRIRGDWMLNRTIWYNALCERHVQTTVLLLGYVPSWTLGPTKMRLVFYSWRIQIWALIRFRVSTLIVNILSTLFDTHFAKVATESITGQYLTCWWLLLQLQYLIWRNSTVKKDCFDCIHATLILNDKKLLLLTP